MLTTLFATLIMLAPGQDAKPTMCPIMGGPAAKEGPVVEFAGSKYEFCCAGCDATFQKDPAGALKAEKIQGKTVGVFLFDPVSHHRIEAMKAKGMSEFGGQRYYFETAANKATFDKNMKKYAAVPAKESLVCPVSHETIANYDKAGLYADFNGVRYYICCADCEGSFKGKEAEYAKGVAKSVKTPAAIRAGGK
ncbi:MAG: hypothetical protein M9921_10015 [Fimbriimonadaceae bacterium]|nr:hypothetical protein [Fimbriimonadaceae bacterium]